MKYPKKSHPGSAGAPRKAETKKRYNVMLSDQSAKDLQQIGGGNRSAGIDEVLSYYLAHAFGVTQPTLHAPDKSHTHPGAGGSE